MLDPKRWPEAESLLDRALAEPPDRRDAFLAREVSDPALAEELALVIAEADRPDDFLAPGGAVSGPLFAAFAAADGDVDQNVAGIAGIAGIAVPECRGIAGIAGIARVAGLVDARGRGALEERRALEEGQTLGPYRVDRPIGRGGMGEVYRARDLRLGRDVALKVLPSGVVVDGTRRARVEREARTLAALSHPNIAAIHDLYEDPPVVALVLELIEGPTLAERLVRGPLPLDLTIAIARQIVDAMRRRARTRHRAPRSQTIEHQGDARRLRQDPRLRPRAGGQSRLTRTKSERWRHRSRRRCTALAS